MAEWQNCRRDLTNLTFRTSSPAILSASCNPFCNPAILQFCNANVINEATGSSHRLPARSVRGAAREKPLYHRPIDSPSATLSNGLTSARRGGAGDEPNEDADDGDCGMGCREWQACSGRSDD